METRASWTTNLGFILAAAGSAAGLANIWKFPRVALGNGGGAFILVYILIVLLIGVTVMLSEFAIGRNAHRNIIGSIKAVNRKFTFIGGMCVLSGFIVLSYYSSVGGWVLKYCIAYITGGNSVYSDPERFFMVEVLGQGTAFPIQGAIIYPLIFIAVTAFIVFKGIAGGIEKINKILLPLLFVILILLCIRGVTIEGGTEGLSYLLKPDFSKISGPMILAALGQAFFSLSLGMAIMVTYASYLPTEENLLKNAVTVCGIDVLVAIMAGFALIPIAFSAGLDIVDSENTGFAFISLAKAFESMHFGTFFGALFYILLLLAALTTAVSILEGTTAYVTEELHIERRTAVICLSILMFGIGILYTASQACLDLKGIWIDANGIAFPPLGVFMEFLTDKLLMPLGAFGFCILVGWVWGVDNAALEISSHGKYPFRTKAAYRILVKFIAPISILLILLQGLHII